MWNIFWRTTSVPRSRKNNVKPGEKDRNLTENLGSLCPGTGVYLPVGKCIPLYQVRLCLVRNSFRRDLDAGIVCRNALRTGGHSDSADREAGNLRFHESGIRRVFIRMVAGRRFRGAWMECTDCFGSGVHWYLYCQCQNKHRK